MSSTKTEWPRTQWWWSLAVVVVLVLSVATCGDSDDQPAGNPDMSTTSDATGSGDADGAATSGQCTEDTPDCEDTEVADDARPGTSQPPTSDGGGEVESSTGMPANGGLSVSEALDSDAEGVTGVLAVRGHLYDEGAGAALCETLTGGGERYTCRGPLLPVEGLNLELIRDAVIIHDGLTYTEEEITVLGQIVDGTLIVDPNVS